jgi:WD40 repeat protein
VDVAISSEPDMCVTAGADGICNVHTVRTGAFVRTLSSTNQGLSSITALSLSSEGSIVFSSLNLKNEMSYLHLYSVNGKILAVDCIDNKIELVETENDRLVTADRNGLLEIRCLTSLEVLKSFSLQEKIYDVNLTKHGSHILVGCDHGEVCILGPVSQTL